MEEIRETVTTHSKCDNVNRPSQCWRRW